MHDTRTRHDTKYDHARQHPYVTQSHQIVAVSRLTSKAQIFLIVDGHPVHKAKKVSEFVKEKADGRLSIFFLPPYSPDLNPDEWVWNNVKNDRIGRSVIMSADDLKAKAIGALRRLQKLPGIVRGFLRDPKLAYILELHPGTARGVYKGISSLVCVALADQNPR